MQYSCLCRGGSNAIGTFYPFIKDNVKLYGVEAAGRGKDTNQHALAIGKERLVCFMDQNVFNPR